MTDDPPFNPLPLPDDLLLKMKTDSDPTPQNDPGIGHAKQAPARKRKAKRRNKANSETPNFVRNGRWQRIKDRLHARLSCMEPETLRRILTAAGVAAGVILAILIAIKLTPVALVLLAILGLGFLLRLWNWLRFQPPPF
jgi:hypothetical protein